MAKTSTERHMDWRNRVTFKARIFDDLNTERAARIRAAFPSDERPEVRAVVEFFANYPRCLRVPTMIETHEGYWCVTMPTRDNYEAAAARVALREITSLNVLVECEGRDLYENVADDIVRREVAEMRALGLWGRS